MHSNVIHWRVICLSPLLKKCAKMFLMASRLLAVTHAPLSKQSQSLTLQVQSFVNLQREHLKVVCVFFITRLCRIKNINFNLPMHTLSLMLYHVSLYPCVSDICVSVHLSVSVCLSVCLSLLLSFLLLLSLYSTRSKSKMHSRHNDKNLLWCLIFFRMGLAELFSCNDDDVQAFIYIKHFHF